MNIDLRVDPPMADQSTKPLVTVYIPCRNYGRFLGKAVESLFDQLYSNWEAIIIDEASTDASASIIANLVSRAPERITAIYNEKPEGLQRIANRVLGLSKGKYIMRLDADDWLSEVALLIMVAKLEANPDAGLVYGNHYYTDEAGHVIGTERRHQLGSEDVSGHLPPHGACTLVRARSLKAVGGYSEDIDAQDGWELWYKLQSRVGAVNLDVPVFYYRQHGNSLSRDNTRLLNARKKIFKKIAKTLEGGYEPTAVAVIAVKEDYPMIGGVPYQEFEGCTLIERAIREASAARAVSTVIVSTDSADVIEYCAQLEKLGSVPQHERVLRTGSLGNNSLSVPAREILEHSGQCYQERHGVYPDIMLFLSLHALRRQADHIDKALDILRITESDSVVSVQEERSLIFTHGKQGLDLLNPGRFVDLSYDKERLYRFNGAIIGSWWEVLKEDLLGEKTAYIEMSTNESLQLSDVSSLQQ